MCRLKKIRNRKAASQSWSCYYCEQPIWKDNPVAFAAKHNITIRQARLLQTTAEHLVPRGEGGLDSDTNIVAACFYCNIRRHKCRTVLSPATYAIKVRDPLRSGRGHRSEARRVGTECVRTGRYLWSQYL